MVRYLDVAGNVNTQRNARGKHFVQFDLAVDKGTELKALQPNLGWVPDQDGHPTLPFSIAARLILPIYAERDDRGAALFGEFPTAPLFARLWGAVVPTVDLAADNIFSAVQLAAMGLENKDALYGAAGDWQAVAGTIDGDDLCRWMPDVTRGDVFAASPGYGSGLAGAEILYTVGPYMNINLRDDGTHYIIAGATLGKIFQSDADEALCDGSQCAADVASGIRDCAWPDLLMQVTPGADDTADVNARGGQRITDLRNKHEYYSARLANTGHATQNIVRLLPLAMQRKSIVPCLAAIYSGAISGGFIAESIGELADALRITNYKQVDDRSLAAVERALRPLQRILEGPAFRAQSIAERHLAVMEKIDTTKLTAKTASDSSSTSPAESTSDTKTASGKLLLAQLTKPDALDLLQQLSDYRVAADYDPLSYLEWAHSGRWPPEMRALKQASAAAMKNGTAAEKTARREALDAIVSNDARAPVGALVQLAWGHVRNLEGYPELQDVYDLGQTRMPDVVARLCARAYSADGASVPPALRFARAAKLTTALKARQWGSDVDFSSDGDACMLSYIEGGSGTELVRIPADQTYTDISQLLRTRRIGANVLAFFGVRDGATLSWRQLVSTCEHAFQGVAASDGVKRVRLGNAMRRFVQRALDDVGKRIDLVRYSAKHDAVGPRDLLSASKGGPADEFAEAVARIQEDQKRKRSEVADDKEALTSVRLPAEAKGVKRPTPPEKIDKYGYLPAVTGQQAESTDYTDSGRHVSFKATSAEMRALEAASGGGKHTPLALVKHVKTGDPSGKITIHVDKPAALRWLADHGVPRACLGFQYGHVCKHTRRWQSCGTKGNAHTEKAEGPHKLVDGWMEAAPTFVKAADRATYFDA